MCSITAAGLAISGIGTIFSVLSSRQQGKNEAQEFGIQQQELQVEQTLRTEDRRRALNREVARQKAAMGASGTLVNFGPLETTGREFAFEQFTDDFNFQRKFNALGRSSSSSTLTAQNKGISSLFDFASTATLGIGALQEG